ncbi:hypothetical protein N4P33_28815 [Streptomyces sp. 15-116A]|uniref:hypothetical protein n=1 Tax=Streptomyces sp. 15-116A TaxID=2259035 RepID=UPI0021B2E7BF|nr:hypothetical protein [Streptomyces sp. 15-116A]MCT7356123.1 hypothetical protein [Streptomyces sp. 15-116A]
MSLSPSLRTPSGPRRRSLLAVASAAVPAALLSAGCSAESESSGEGAGRRPSAEERARARAAQESRELVERYDAVIVAHPKLAGRLGALREAVVRQGEAFGGVEGVASPSASVSAAAAAAASASASTESSGVGSSASPSASAVPVKEKDALAQLAAAERELADRRVEALLDAPGELARLLASVAAAGAARAYLLTKG